MSPSNTPKKTVTKKPAAKKATVKKAAVKKPVVAKKAVARKVAAKKVAVKAVVKKVASKKAVPLLEIEVARANRFFPFAGEYQHYTPPTPQHLGVHQLRDYPLAALVPYIDFAAETTASDATVTIGISGPATCFPSATAR